MKRTWGALMASAVALLLPALPVHASAPPPDTVPSADEPLGDIGLGNPAPGEVVHSWALAPAGSSTSDGAGNRSSLSYLAEPGTVVQDAVTLYNLGTEALTFRVYATDGFNNADGGFDLLAGSEEATGVGSWISVQQENITVNPNRQVTIPITLTVPADATPGDYAGAVLASSETLSSGDGGNLVTLDRRTGTRLLVRVPGELSPEIAVTGIATEYSPAVNPLGGSAAVTYIIENRGNVVVSGTTSASIAGPFGFGRVSGEGVEFTDLLPGQTIEFAANLEDVPAFGLAFTEVEVRPTSQDLEVDAVTVSNFTFAPPVSVLLGLLALLFLVLGIRAFKRHRAQTNETDFYEQTAAELDDAAAREHQVT